MRESLPPVQETQLAPTPPRTATSPLVETPPETDRKARQITLCPKLAARLDEVVAEEKYGATRESVAQVLLWQALDALIK